MSVLAQLDPNLPPENDQSQKYSSGYPNESRPYLLWIFIENCNNFLLYLGFVGVQMGQNFSSFSVAFYTFWYFFLISTYIWINRISRSIAFSKSFEKKSLKNRIFKRLVRPENYWWGHQQPYNFFPISEHFQITQENQNQLIRSKKIVVTGGKIFLIISKWKIFICNPKKPLYH